MSTNYYSSYEQERKNAPKQCPHCGEPINQDLSSYGSKVRHHCGSQACRKAYSRANILERKHQARRDARQRILAYGNRWLDLDQRRSLMTMTQMVMDANFDTGHQIAEQIVQIIESQRCKHDRISVLIENAALAKRRADEAQAHNRDMEAQYKHRIAELESELVLLQLLQGSIDKIAAEQLDKQADPIPQEPEPEEEDEDRNAVLATLALAGIEPYTGGQDDSEE
ncbi:hypothetical protein KDA_77140 [Dictyobacter alpinus]|uniref:Uncharacterized protein n=1 Tax=Dictyobacter alpinus TaxID=2014873 RepID=A0A402BLQ1_9CHLR|nr:hypothetical protein [Dictyobacter alpinus]GCE32230.1 hypothetical protein KDA_77140 [Dictyobacter alpinus]